MVPVPEEDDVDDDFSAGNFCCVDLTTRYLSVAVAFL